MTTPTITIHLPDSITPSMFLSIITDINDFIESEYGFAMTAIDNNTLYYAINNG
jgi:hypothetical protein